jgi:protein tyrosine/serine phosphatase
MSLKEPHPGMRLTAVLLALSLLVSPHPSWAKCHEPRDCNPTTITPKEICNFHKVDSDLYRGGRPTCVGLAKLEALGVRTFIDLGGAGAAIHHCKAEAEARGIHFIRVKISLPQIVLTGVPDRQVRNLFADMRSASKPIFVSCSLGRDRTGMVVALYRIKRSEMSFDEAWQEAVHYGYRPHFRGLRRALNRYRERSEIEQLPAPSSAPARPGAVCQASGDSAINFPAPRL